MKVTLPRATTEISLIPQLPAAPLVAVGHFAPFADTIDGTAAEITVKGTLALVNVKFKEYTDDLSSDGVIT